MGRTKGSLKKEFISSQMTLTGEGLDYYWTQEAIDEVVKLYENSATLPEIVKESGRKAVEVMILIDDCLRNQSTKLIGPLILGRARINESE